MAPEDSDSDGRDGSGGEDATDDIDESLRTGETDYDGTAEDDPFGHPYPDSEREDPFGDPYPDPDREQPAPEAEEQPEDSAVGDQTRTVSDGFGSPPPDTDEHPQQGPASQRRPTDSEPASRHPTDSEPAPHRRADADSEPHHSGDSEPIPRRRETTEPEPPRKRTTSREPSGNRQSTGGRSRRPNEPRRGADPEPRSFDGRWSLRNDRSTGRNRSRSDDRSTGRNRSRSDDRSTGRTGRPTFGPGTDRHSTNRRATDEQSSLRFERDQQSALYSELHALEETMPERHVTKPYLERVPDGYDAELAVMEWIEGLITTAGYESTLDALAYYRSIGWISTDVERTLEEHANTIARSTADGDYEFSMQDHRRSLRAIARIAQSGR